MGFCVSHAAYQLYTIQVCVAQLLMLTLSMLTLTYARFLNLIG